MAATNKRGVFSLEKVLERQGDDNWTNILDPFIYVDTYTGGEPVTTTIPSTGYFAGGFGVPSNYTLGLSSVDRIDFTNDTGTASPKGKLVTSRGSGGGAGNITHGYIFGGAISLNGSTTYSTISRIQYSNDTVTTTTVSNLSNRNGWYGHTSSVGNNNFGYTGGTNDGGAPAYTGGGSILDRLDYANDTSTASARGSGIFDPRGAGSAATGNRNFGYFGGGYNSSVGTLSSIRKIDYASDTATMAPAGPLSGSARYKGATGNGNYGYYNLGAASSGSNGTAITRLDFASDTSTTSPKGPLNRFQSANSAATGDNNFGYFGGHSVGFPVSNWFDDVARIDYDNDTVTASAKGPLGTYAYSRATFSAKENGNPQSPTTSIPPISFTPATQVEGGKLTDKGSDGYPDPAPPSPTLGPAVGYVLGGYSPSSPYNQTTLVQRSDFASDTNTLSPRGGLARGVAAGGVASSMTHGYHAGGAEANYGGGDSMKGLKFNYANESSSLVRNFTYSMVRYRTAVGNANFGYWMSGDSADPSQYEGKSITKVDFANDTEGGVRIQGLLTSNFESPTGPLSYGENTRGKTATGNANFGYIAGGMGRSTLERLDYANDNINTVLKGTLGFSAPGSGGGGQGLTAFGNESAGYFAGAMDPYPAQANPQIRYIDYSNDDGATFYTYVSNVGGFWGSYSSPSYGWITGGYPNNGYPLPQGPRFSYTQRLDFANGYPAYTSTRGNLAVPVAECRGVSPQMNANSTTTGTGLIPRMRFIDDVKEGFGSTAAVPEVPTPPATGYFTGGDGGATRVQRMDFDNDTTSASPKGNLSQQHQRGGGTGNLTHGYTIAGIGNSYVDRVDYANDTLTASPRGRLATIADYISSVGNNNFAYTGGRPWSYPNMTGKIDYANDTVTETILNPAGFTQTPGYDYAAVGNRNYGYFAGGWNNTAVRRLDYANDTAATLQKGPLSSVCPYASGTGNGNFGYINPGHPAYQTKIERINYANDSASTDVRGPLGAARSYRAATGDNNYGYWSGGSPSTSYIFRVDYNSDTATASPKGNLGIYTYRHQAFSAKENGNPQSKIPAVPFFAGVQAPFQPPFPFPRPFPPLTSGYAYSANGKAYGIIPYGYSVFSSVDRIDLSNDTATTVSRTPTPQEQSHGGSASSHTHGYMFGGGLTQHVVSISTIIRLDYSNDTLITTVGSLTAPSDYSSSVGNQYYGYNHTTTSPSGTQIDRLDYANDSATALTRGPLANGNWSKGTMGTQSHGYFAGGYWGSTVDRIAYASDTATALTRGNLSGTQVGAPTGVSNGVDVGYIVGGHINNPSTRVDRIEFANDTVQATPKGNLSVPVSSVDIGTGTKYAGYIVGGYSDPSAPVELSVSTIQKMNYANDTSTASPSGNLTFRRYNNRAFSPFQNGLSS